MKRYVHYDWGIHESDSKWHKKGDLNYLKSRMFDITIRYPTGTMEHEIEKLRNFVINSLSWVDYYSIGIEGDNDIPIKTSSAAKVDGDIGADHKEASAAGDYDVVKPVPV